MKVRFSVALAAALLAGGAAVAQNGVIPNLMQFKNTDMLRLSGQSAGFTTARVSAMGGAFASLGADLASISINPAGLGMYRSSQFGITPAVTVSNDHSSAMALDNDRTRFGFNNIGIALNLYEGAGSLVSFTFGFSYNKMADFNYRTGVALPAGGSSMLDIFNLQLNGLYRNWSGLRQGWLGSDARPNPFSDGSSVFLDEWGAVLAYQTEAIDPVSDAESNTRYVINALEAGAGVVPSMQYNSRGSIGEYAIAGGINIGNWLYMGLTVGLQDIYQKQDYYYDEGYLNNGEGQPNPEKYLDYMLYDQHLKVSGTGVNFKFGIIVRPLPELRIGVAVHTPTFSSIDRRYYATMGTGFRNGDRIDRDTYGLLNSWNYNTPTRLMFGASYTFGPWAVVSVDYERTWYNGMRLTDESHDVKQYYKELVKNDFKATNTVRVGAEVKPLPELAVRAGYTWTSSPLKYDLYNDTCAKERQSVSFGLGYRFPMVSIDLAYTWAQAKYSDYTLFYYDGPAPDGSALLLDSGIVRDAKRTNHIIAATLGVYF